MNLFRYIVLGAVMGTPLWASAQAPDLASMDIVQKSVPDGPVIRVGRQTIADIDFVLLYRSELNRFAQTNPTAPLTDENRVRIALYCVDILVEQELLYQEAVRHQLPAPADEVTKQATAQYERLRKGFSQTAGREVTESEILDRLGYQDRSEINDEIKRAILVAMMRKRIMSEHEKSISDSAIAEVYEENKAQFSTPDRVHLRQIFMLAESTDAAVRVAAKQKAADALERLFSGQRFETVAKEVSESSDAAQGGDMGFKAVEVVLPVMREALKSMQAEDISEVLESEFGYHIIQLVARKDAQDIPKDKAYSIIRSQLVKQESQQVVRQYCDRLIESNTRVDVFLEMEQNLALLSGQANVTLE